MKDLVTKYYLPLTLFIFSVITAILIVVIHSAIIRNNNPQKKIDSFNIQLNERYEKINSLLQQLTIEIDSNSFTTINKISSRLPSNSHFFIIENDSLIYWSDNLIDFDLSRTGTRILKTGNGFFQQSVVISKNTRYVLLDLIKNSYPYENDYLSSSYNDIYSIPPSYNIQKTEGDYSVTSKQGEVLFYITTDETSKYSGEQEFVLYALSILVFSLILFSIYYFAINSGSGKLLALSIVFVSALFIRSVTFILEIPSYIQLFDFFSPVNYASSFLLPSLGDLFTNIFLLTLVSFIIFRTFRQFKVPQITKPAKLIILVSGQILLVIIHYSSLYLIDTLIINSSFELNLSRILDFSVYSIIAYFIIAMILFSLFYLTYTIIRVASQIISGKLLSFLILATAAIIWCLSKYQGFYTPLIQEVVLYLLYLIFIVTICYGLVPFPHIISTTILVLLLTLISTFCLYHNKETKEHEERKLMALRLSSDQDKVGEYLYNEVENAIRSDTTLNNLFMSAWLNPEGEEACINYLLNHYFNGYWTKYNAQITLCYPEKQLELKPSGIIIGCNEYFDRIINTITENTSAATLFYVKESYGASNYIARIPLYNESENPASLIIELTQKYVPKGLGYPELLLDKSFISFYDLSTYSYAIYSKGELIKNVGEYSYSISEKPFLPFKADYNFFDKNGYNHLYHVVNDNTSIIVSKKNLNTLDKLAPFTYQLIFHILLIFILTTVYNLKYTRQRYLDLKTQLQIMLVAMVLFSSMIIGGTTIHNIRNLNDEKNQDMLSEKAHSVLIEIEHKLDDYNSLELIPQPYLQELLTKFSQVFFSDINIYKTNGDLLATSRPEIFEEGLRSTYMSPEAFNEIAINQRTFFVTNEKIGKYEYLSAYIPFRNKENQLMAYINLPYFAREHELRQEISSFLVTFVNIYIILTAFAVFLSLLIGNYLTRPLKLIRDKFSNVKLDRKNEKISYNRRDELGSLINEYNLMLDKLADSVDKLSQSERESAWKEMARQIAHEIKNPLTPMKLSIQHLYRSWNDKAPDWEQRLEKTTTSMIQQIDSLAAIASAFSDFAKFPSPQNKNVELIKLIKDTITLFVPQKEFSISFIHPEHPCFVYADEKQLTRVMVNLINNAIQSIPVGKKGNIEILVKSESHEHIILITDNGIGIAEEQKSKIFSPNFTTKSGGTGLGLAMVKNIVNSANGSIGFKSDSNGTTFEIHLPAVKLEE